MKLRNDENDDPRSLIIETMRVPGTFEGMQSIVMLCVCVCVQHCGIACDLGESEVRRVDQ